MFWMAWMVLGAVMGQQVPAAASIRGTVVDAVTGAGLGSALVTATAAGDSPALSTFTSLSGEWEFRDIPAGRYGLTAKHEAFLAADRPSIVNAMAGLDAHARLALMPPGAIRGVALDDEGKPLAGVAVFAFYWSDALGGRRLAFAGSAETSRQGVYRIGGLAPRSYLAAAKPPDRAGFTLPSDPGAEFRYSTVFYPSAAEAQQAVAIRVAPGETASGVDFRFAPVRTVAVRGFVDASSATVTLAPASAAGVEALMARFARLSPLEAGGTAFEIRGVTPGAYRLDAGTGAGGERRSARQEIQVGVSDVDRVRLSLATPFTLEGEVAVEGGETAPPEVTLVLMPETLGMLAAVPMHTARDGAISLRDVTEQPYSLRVSGLPPAMYVKSVRCGDADSPDGSVRPSPGARLRVLVSNRAASLSGDCPAPGDSVWVKAIDGGAPRESVCDDRAGFEIGGLAPGVWEIQTSGQSQKVRLGEGERKQVRMNFSATAERTRPAPQPVTRWR